MSRRFRWRLIETSIWFLAALFWQRYLPASDWCWARNCLRSSESLAVSSCRKDTILQTNGFPQTHILNTAGLVDVIEEIRLRTWARQHYTRSENRDSEWHPIILDEMRSRDEEKLLTV